MVSERCEICVLVSALHIVWRVARAEDTQRPSGRPDITSSTLQVRLSTLSMCLVGSDQLYNTLTTVSMTECCTDTDTVLYCTVQITKRME